MASNPDLWQRVSLPHGHFTVPAVIASRGPWRVLKQDALDKTGRPLPPKLRVDLVAATPTPDTEAPAPVESEESE